MYGVYSLLVWSTNKSFFSCICHCENKINIFYFLMCLKSFPFEVMNMLLVEVFRPVLKLYFCIFPVNFGLSNNDIYPLI